MRNYLSYYEPTSYNSTNDSYLNSPPGKLFGRFKITVESNKIYVFNPEDNSKHMLASFILSEDKLQTIKADGEKQLWIKQ